MELLEFQEKAKEIAGHDDYRENEDLLDLIPAEYRKDYISALFSGYKMKPSFSGLTKAIGLSSILILQ